MEQKEQQEQQEPKGKRRLGLSLIVAAIVFMGVSYATWFFNNNLQTSLIVGMIISIFVFLVCYIDEDKPVKQIKQQLESLTSDEIRSKIKENLVFNEYGIKLIDKRKEWSVGEFLSDHLMGIVYGGIVVFVFGIFYLGAMPAYYGVNNLFLNPINSSMGLNSSLDLVSLAGYKIISNLMGTGAQHPATFFWLWWLLVFITFIYPLICIILFFIRRRGKSKSKEVKQI